MAAAQEICEQGALTLAGEAALGRYQHRMGTLPNTGESRSLYFASAPARARVAPSPPLGLAAGRTTGPRLGAASEADHGDGGR